MGDGKRHERRRQRGQSLVEMALLLPVLCTIMLGALDLGRAYYSYAAVANAARVGAQYAAYATVWPLDAAAVEAKVRDEASDVSVRDVTLTPESGWAQGQDVTVAVVYDFHFLTPGASRIWGEPLTITYAATARFH